MENLEQPKINVLDIQKKANEAAEKAYLKEIEEYYTSYNSPYRKLVKEELEKQEFKFSMELPNILEKINSSLSKEIDAIANKAIASTYIPMVNNSLVGLEKELKMSDILKLIIQEIEPDENEKDDYYFDYEKHDKYDWLSCSIRTDKNRYEFTLHTCRGDSEEQKYQLLSFPSAQSNKGYQKTMIVYKDDVKIEMPFAPNILQDKILNVFFRVMISQSEISMDCDGFEEDMFPSEECYC